MAGELDCILDKMPDEAAAASHARKAAAASVANDESSQPHRHAPGALQPSCPTRECPQIPSSGPVSLWAPRSCHTPPTPGCRITQNISSHICPGIHKKVSRSGESKRDSGTFRTGLVPPIPDQSFCKATLLTSSSPGLSSSGESDSPRMAFRKRPTMSGSYRWPRLSLRIRAAVWGAMGS